MIKLFAEKEDILFVEPNHINRLQPIINYDKEHGISIKNSLYNENYFWWQDQIKLSAARELMETEKNLFT